MSQEPVKTTTCPNQLKNCIEKCDKALNAQEGQITALEKAVGTCKTANERLMEELDEKNVFWRDPAFIWPAAGAAGVILAVIIVGAVGGLSK